ncbi:MAG TPA: type II secretion system protein N [Ramlibacter sp.]|uniref:type II secretion system protein N n=1 Tax=Ramlibacter sp. TaxID=1917967 RepID=UPI002D7FE8F3|nr:type II secretion system protein N [Ramlibacter sp.]HET8746066.1 type II secretion system protein N [Ramlibacter sp.]
MARAKRSVREVPWAWAWAGAALGLVLAVILFAPARWLAGAVERLSGEHVLLADARGTVWQGSARVILTGGPGSTDSAALPGRVAWTLHPRFNGVAAALRAECCTPQPIPVRARWRWGGLAVDVGDASSQWPASVTAGLGTPWNTLQFEGDLRLATQGLSVEWVEGRPAIAGRAELVALRVTSRLSTLRPMGSYRITVQGGTPATLRLETLEGSLQLSGTGQWVGERLHFRGEASAAPEREAALSNLLNIIGRRSGVRSLISIG